MFEHHWEITIFSLNLFYMITASVMKELNVIFSDNVLPSLTHSN